MGYRDKTKQRAATRKHYEENRERLIAEARVRNETKRKEIYAYLLRYLQDHPCVDCGETDPIVLEFDHRDHTKKEFHVSEAAKRQMSFDRIRVEIAKCDVRCANCHRRRTYKQFGWGIRARFKSFPVHQLQSSKEGHVMRKRQVRRKKVHRKGVSMHRREPKTFDQSYGHEIKWLRELRPTSSKEAPCE